MHTNVTPMKLPQPLAPGSCFSSKNSQLPSSSQCYQTDCYLLEFFLYTCNPSSQQRPCGHQPEPTAGFSLQSCHCPLDNLSRRPWHVSHSIIWCVLGGSSSDSACNEHPWMFRQIDINARMHEGL